jgi:beta-glucosidase
VRVSAQVENIGDRAGDEVVQLYTSDLKSSASVPIRSLQGLERIHLAPGEKRAVEFALKPEQMALYKANGDRIVEPGEFEVSVGGGQPGARGTEENGNLVRATFELVGPATLISD